MKINRRPLVRLITRYSSLVTLLGSGCAQQQAAESASEPAVVAVVIAQPVSGPGADALPQPAPAAQPPAPPAPPPPTFAFPADLTGQGLARVVAPDVTRPLPAERVGAGPRPRAVPEKVLDPDAFARVGFAPPPVLPPRPTAPKPVAPPEKVPVNFGAGADGGPAKPVLPVAVVATERARDANLPPPAPVLGRPVADRASLDDPTGEFGNAAVVAGVVPVPLAASGFQKVAIPDPFELAEHVKPPVPAPAEPSAQPVPVNPQRVK